MEEKATVLKTRAELEADVQAWIEDDPVRTNQSKHVGEDGELRYDADGSRVFGGASGCRTLCTRLGDYADQLMAAEQVDHYSRTGYPTPGTPEWDDAVQDSAYRAAQEQSWADALGVDLEVER